MNQTNHPCLTKREKQILEWVSCGFTNKEIAKVLRIKPVAVEFHLGNIFKKLGAANRTEAVVLAEQIDTLKTYGNP